jgi:hypothetical protein
VVADGKVFIATDLTSGSAPLINIGVKAGSGFTTASIAGNYALVSFSKDSTTSLSELNTISIDSTGLVTSLTDTVNNNGTLHYPTLGAQGTLTVASDGTFTSGGGSSAGAVSGDGDVVVVQDLTQGDTPNVTFGVKQGTGVTLATLGGTYTAISYASDDVVASGTSVATAGLITLTLDGNGNLSGTATFNNAGTNSSSSVSGTYTVQSDGTTTFTLADGTVYNGAASGDGTAIVLADVTSGDAAEIAVAVRH